MRTRFLLFLAAALVLLSGCDKTKTKSRSGDFFLPVMETTDIHGYIVSREDDLEHIDFSRPIRLYSQTTKSRDEYRRLIANIEARLPQGADFVAYDTVCNRVANRAKELETFARSVDVLLFVAGENSSNGHYLYEYCRNVQPRTHLIATADEVRREWFADANSVGISGATSTPRWLMEEVKLKIER